MGFLDQKVGMHYAPVDIAFDISWQVVVFCHTLSSFSDFCLVGIFHCIHEIAQRRPRYTGHMDGRGWKSTASYVALLAASFVVAVAGSWQFGTQVDNYAYDAMFRWYRPQPWQTQSAILAIDESTLLEYGGMRGIRRPLAAGLRRLAAMKPAVVAVDMILADKGDPKEDAELAEAFRTAPNLVLDCELIENGQRWEDPRPEFRQSAAALGHVHAQPDAHDAVTRAIPLELHTGMDQRWALAYEAFRLSRGVRQPVLTPDDLQVGNTIIPVKDTKRGRIMRVRYLPPYMAIPRVSLKRLIEYPADDPADDPVIAAQLTREVTGKVVFVGVTAMSEARDRLFTPLANGQTTGIEIHADAFETMAQGLFLTDVDDRWVLLFSIALIVAAGAGFRYLPGWWAYLAGALILLAGVTVPYVFFTHRLVFSFATPAFVAWLGTTAAAGYYHLVVRRNLRIEQSSRERYQQAMHFVTHEMRTPLSAIQGSSELISRYALNDEKRKQIALLINSESKRLARMVEIFLNVERLSAGQMQLKRETISVKQMVEVCVERVRPLGERKHIAISLQPVAGELYLAGDRELIEYACYNLLTNAVKYSPQRTTVSISAWKDAGHVRIAVRDQGIGIDQKEVKQIFQKFYRTKKAEESGEAGTGIGLSIVQQIVEQHGGRIEVTSQPGAGSCFTLVVAQTEAPVPITAE
jgi:signal transduction histidine kinase